MKDALDPSGDAAARLQPLAPQALLVAQAMAAASGELVIVVGLDGRLLGSAAGDAAPATAAPAAAGAGRPWVEAVAPDSQAKVGRMLAELARTGQAGPREINHRAVQDGPPVALACRGIRLGPGGPCLVIGHDLGAQVRLQQRFVAAQAQLEAAYGRAGTARADG